MKFNLFIFISLLFLQCSPSATTSTALPAYTNPLPVAFGDPYILNDSAGKWYLYGTGGVRDGFIAYSSGDMVNWKKEGQIFWGNTDSSWGIGAFWAPEVYKMNGKYY